MPTSSMNGGATETLANGRLTKGLSVAQRYFMGIALGFPAAQLKFHLLQLA